MRALYNLQKPEANLKGLRGFYDQIESYVRVLESLENPPDTYGDLLVCILLDKLPGREKYGSWGLDRFQHCRQVNRQAADNNKKNGADWDGERRRRRVIPAGRMLENSNQSRISFNVLSFAPWKDESKPNWLVPDKSDLFGPLGLLSASCFPLTPFCWVLDVWSVLQ